MQISKINICNFHSLKEFELTMDDYTILIGPNGSGKSSVLYALDWFFNGRTLDAADIHNFLNNDGIRIYSDEEISANPELDTIRVSITFDQLTDNDRALLKSYGKGETAYFCKTWRYSDNKEKFIGNALQGPGFANVRVQPRIGDLRTAYSELQHSITGLPDLGTSPAPSKESILSALQAWEDEPDNVERLILINNDDASHMFGFNGPNVMRDCISFTLIPASCDMAADITQNKKGSTLNTLIGQLMSSAGIAAKQAWIEENQETITQLTTDMKSAIDRSTQLQSGRISERMRKLIPSASLEFDSRIPDWIPNPLPEISTKVTINGSQREITKQGDGVQRAVMIAMFETLVPDENYIRNTFTPEAEWGEEEARTRLNEALEKLPAIIVCIEEPEIYQHPVRARTFSRALTELSSHANSQVMIATHSPYFVQPKQFVSIRRFSLIDGCSINKRTTVSQISQRCSIEEAKVRKSVDLHLATTFSEGFFSDKVAIVEGQTDKAILEAIADKLNTPFDSNDISVLDISGKDGMQIPYHILEALGTPTYIVIDGDALGAARKYPTDADRQRDSDNNKRISTENVIRWLPQPIEILVGNHPYAYQAPTIVTDKFTFWEDDIEHELEYWPSFCTALSEIGTVLRSEKNLQTYRQAVIDASLDDMPDTLKKCVEAIIAF